MAAWVVARRVTSGRWHRWIGDWDEAMSRRITPPQAGAPSGSSATTTTGTRALLACGVVAGPLVVAVAVLQALTRQGFDPSRHPLSLLRLGALAGSRSPTSWSLGCWWWRSRWGCGGCCTPAGAPEQLSWHGILHDLAHLLALLSLTLACLVLARRVAGLGQRAGRPTAWPPE
jgi:hypothetical protein